MEHVLGVVPRFHLGEPPVGVVAVSLADATRVVVGVEEVHVDTGTVGLEGGEESSCPRGLCRPDGIVLLGEPCGVDDDVVLHVAAGVGGGVPGNSGHCAPQMEHRRVRPRGRCAVGVRGDDVDDLVGQAGEVRGLPVVVPAVGDGVVEAALMVDVQGGSDQIHDRGPELAECTDGPLTVVDGSGVAAAHGDCRPEVKVLVDHRQRRDRAEPDDVPELVRCVGDELAVEAQDVGGVLGRPEHRSGHDGGADRVQREPERADDAEVPASASQGPEQVGVIAGRHPHDLALGGDHLGLYEIVDGEPVLAHEPADAAAQTKAADAGMAHYAARGSQTVCLCLMVDISPQGTALDDGRALDRIDRDGAHRR